MSGSRVNQVQVPGCSSFCLDRSGALAVPIRADLELNLLSNSRIGRDCPVLAGQAQALLTFRMASIL